jgi:SPX domain protein involved in polyphosphate accumulation
MKFGKQLQLGTYDPWKDYYIQYSKLKRIIKRRKFVSDKQSDVSTFGVINCLLKLNTLHHPVPTFSALVP